jgi:hypothetical protein
MNIYEEGTSTEKNVLKEKPIQGMNNVSDYYYFKCETPHLYSPHFLLRYIEGRRQKETDSCALLLLKHRRHLSDECDAREPCIRTFTFN